MDRELRDEFRLIRDGSRRVLSKTCQKYLASLVSPSTGPLVGVPSLLGGVIGDTKVIQTKAVGKFTIGSGGWGFVKLSNPGLEAVGSLLYSIGPFHTIPCGAYSDGGWAGTALLGTALGAAVGITNFPWTSDYSSTQLSGAFLYRLVSMSIEVFPESSYVSQNGALTLYESSAHADMTRTASRSLQDIEGYNTSRTIRATQFGDLSEKIVINWHPRTETSATGPTSGIPDSRNDFNFVNPQAAGFTTTQMPSDGLMVFAEGAPNTIFHFKCVANWELKGSAVHGKKARLADSRGMDLVMNTIRLDGYTGKPGVVVESYMAKALHLAGSLGITKQKVGDFAIKAISNVAGF